MGNEQLAATYLGELLDRVLRFEMHLKAVENEFYRGNVGDGHGNLPHEQPLFLNSFRACMDQVLTVVFQLGKRANAGLNDDELLQLMQVARHGFFCITELHETGLIHLPRPSEPTELRRFLRMIAKHVLTQEGPDLAVYVTEGTTETSFADDPLGLLKTQVTGLMNLSQSFLGSGPTQATPATAAGIHVTIARIDARNPLRWPTLMHEAAHKLLSREILGGKTLDSQFREWFPESVVREIDALGVNTKSWLTEVWCDLFAAVVLGPAFFFGQFAAFVTAPPVDSFLSPDYPPHSFRLRLIRHSLLHRYPEVASIGDIKDEMGRCIEVVEYWDTYHRLSLSGDHALMVMFNSMLDFFSEHFFSGQGTEVQNVQKKFAKMVRYVRKMETDRLNEIRQSFADGLPAPSKPHSSGVKLAEEPTSIQEVLLAAWMDRLGRMRGDSLSALLAGPSPQATLSIQEALLPAVDRFDDTVLRSHQLAEWLHVLAPLEPKSVWDEVGPGGERDAPDADSGREPPEPRDLLNDREIAALLKSGELRVVPLVDLDQQLGSTSLDIRLGTSFEVYLPAYRRAPDAAETAESYDSRAIDLDFLEHIVLLPGQIVLAHSFEYIRLPPTLAGELEGRSSYARLGLQVHLTAGMIDPGFEGVITLELVNSGSNAIALHPGVRIAQLRLIRVGEPARPYDRRRAAKYRGLLHHRTSLYKSDPDFARLAQARDELKSRIRPSQNPSAAPIEPAQS